MHAKPVLLSLFTAAGLLAGVAFAAQPDAIEPGMPAGATAVSDAALSRARAGFDLGNGLLASFGISRMVYINGNLVANITLNIPDLAHIDSAQAAALAALLGNVTLIRNGPGNFVDPASFNGAAGAIVIQNTLNNQQIQAMTTINATVRNLAQFSSMNIANTMQQALINSRGQ